MYNCCLSIRKSKIKDTQNTATGHSVCCIPVPPQGVASSSSSKTGAHPASAQHRVTSRALALCRPRTRKGKLGRAERKWDRVQKRLPRYLPQVTTIWRGSDCCLACWWVLGTLSRREHLKDLVFRGVQTHPWSGVVQTQAHFKTQWLALFCNEKKTKALLAILEKLFLLHT